MSFQVGKEEGDFLLSDPKKDEVPTHLPFLPLVPKAYKVNKSHESEQHASQTNLFDS